MACRCRIQYLRQILFWWKYCWNTTYIVLFLCNRTCRTKLAKYFIFNFVTFVCSHCDIPLKTILRSTRITYYRNRKQDVLYLKSVLVSNVDTATPCFQCSILQRGCINVTTVDWSIKCCLHIINNPSRGNTLSICIHTLFVCSERNTNNIPLH